MSREVPQVGSPGRPWAAGLPEGDRHDGDHFMVFLPTRVSTTAAASPVSRSFEVGPLTGSAPSATDLVQRSQSRATVPDGSDPRVLDLLEVPLLAPAPDGYQA